MRKPRKLAIFEKCLYSPGETTNLKTT